MEERIKHLCILVERTRAEVISTNATSEQLESLDDRCKELSDSLKALQQQISEKEPYDISWAKSNQFISKRVKRKTVFESECQRKSFKYNIINFFVGDGTHTNQRFNQLRELTADKIITLAY